MRVEVAGRNGRVDATAVQNRLQQIAGVSRVVLKDTHDNRNTFEIESQKGFVRGDLARAIVESGWDLNELRPTAMSLEEIFLQLTGGEKTEPQPAPLAEEPAPVTQGAQQ